MAPAPPPRSASPPPRTRRNAVLLLASMLLPVVVLRLALHASPDQDFDVAGYNVHHLFTGLLFVTLGGVPLALFPGGGPRHDLAVACFGVGLGLALDEWVYLIATDGSNASYLLPVSLWGAVTMFALAVAYIAALVFLARYLRTRN